MSITHDPFRHDKGANQDESQYMQERRSLRPAGLFVEGTLRPAGYWLVWLVLLFSLVIGVGDHLNYIENSETYHRVYENPWLEQAISFLATVVAAVGLVFQARGWRQRRFSRIALAAATLEVAIGFAVPMSGVLVTCCGTM
jgi:uncharacterized membrane protein